MGGVAADGGGGGGWVVEFTLFNNNKFISLINLLRNNNISNRLRTHIIHFLILYPPHHSLNTISPHRGRM